MGRFGSSNEEKEKQRRERQKELEKIEEQRVRGDNDAMVKEAVDGAFYEWLMFPHGNLAEQNRVITKMNRAGFSAAEIGLGERDYHLLKIGLILFRRRELPGVVLDEDIEKGLVQLHREKWTKDNATNEVVGTTVPDNETEGLLEKGAN